MIGERMVPHSWKDLQRNRPISGAKDKNIRKDARQRLSGIPESLCLVLLPAARRTCNRRYEQGAKNGVE